MVKKLKPKVDMFVAYKKAVEASFNMGNVTIKKVQREWEVTVFPKILEAAEIEKWCRDTFGESGRNHKYRWRRNWTVNFPLRFYFKNEKDATVFMLRWS